MCTLLFPFLSSSAGVVVGLQYKFLEEQLTSKQRRLRTQLVDIKATLGILGHLKSKMGDEAGFATEFRLSDALFARAQIPKTDKVCLWLGKIFACDQPVCLRVCLHALPPALQASAAIVVLLCILTRAFAADVLLMLLCPAKVRM